MTGPDVRRVGEVGTICVKPKCTMHLPVQVILTNALEHSCALAGELHLVGGVVHR